MVTTISSSILIFSILLLASFNGAHGRLSTRNPRRQTYADDEDFFSMPMESVEEEEDNVSPLEQRDVCIVGGGPSGSYAAYLLQQKGFSTVLFDEADHLGGKTVPASPIRPHPRHVLTDDMTLVIKFIEKYNLEKYAVERNNINNMSDETPYDITPAKRANFFENLMIGGAPSLSMDVAAAGLRYISKWNENEEVIMQPNNLNLPDDLMKPASQWMRENDVEEIAQNPAFYNGVVNYGYGSLDKVPIIYILKYMTPDKISSFPEPSHPWFPMHLIFDEMGKELDDVHLNSRVESIEKEDDDSWNVHAKSLNGGTDLSYNCVQVILACPPSAKSLSIVKDLQNETRKLFEDNMQIVDYWEWTLSDLPECNKNEYTSCLAEDNFYAKTPAKEESYLERLGEDIPNVYYQPPSKDHAVVLFNGGYQAFNETQVTDVVRNHLQNAFGYDQDDYNITSYKKWDYFPHVHINSMQAGFYDNVEQVQGKQGIYYTGGFLSFELVHNSMKATEDIIDRHF